MKDLRVRLILPRGNQEEFTLGRLERIEAHSKGDPEPVVIVTCLWEDYVQIEIRADEERFTAKDLELLEAVGEEVT